MTRPDSPNLAAVLDAMEDGIYIVRHDYTVEYMNKTMVSRFGPGMGKKCYEVVNRSEIMCPWCRADEVFENGQSVHSEIYMPTVDRTYRIIEVPIRNTDGTISKLSIYRDITEHKDQERRLRASREDFRRLFEHVAAGVYLSTKEGTFVDANAAMLEMLGYESKDEFLAIRLQKDLYVRPEDRLTFQRMIERDGHVVNYPVHFKRRDGSTIPVLLTAHVRHDTSGRVAGYEGICVDQTLVVQLEEKIRKAHDFMNNMIQSSPNAIIGTDMEGTIVIWNRGAVETLGYEPEEVIEKMPVTAIYPEGMARKVMKMMRSDASGGPGKLRGYPMKLIRRDGSLAEGNLSANIICDENGREIASVGFFMDLGEQLEMERQLRRTRDQLLQSEKLAAMGRLTSQLAHELNNPLYGIMNTLELMKTEIAPTSKRRKLLEMSLSETVRLADMLRKMLSFSRPDQEQRGSVDLSTILDEILLLHEKQLQEHSIRIDATLAKDLPTIIASKNQLRQVFLNLVANAKDAMPDGGILTVTTEAVPGQVCATVADSGTGIKPEHLDKIFDTFFTTKADTVKGVGLGLSVCYGFIRDHGGDIRVESNLGEGTTFIVTLPVSPPDPS